MTLSSFFHGLSNKNNWFAKVKRNIAAIFCSVDKDRVGNCIDCGACCKLPTKCFFLAYDKDGKSFCRIYNFRLPGCRKYPRIDKEHITKDTCGFSFDD